MKTFRLLLLSAPLLILGACESAPPTAMPMLSGGSTRTDTGQPKVDDTTTPAFTPGNTEVGAHAMPGQDGSNKLGGGGN